MSLPNNYNADNRVVPLEDVRIHVRSLVFIRRFVEIVQNVVRFQDSFQKSLQYQLVDRLARAEGYLAEKSGTMR